MVEERRYDHEEGRIEIEHRERKKKEIESRAALIGSDTGNERKFSDEQATSECDEGERERQ